MQRFLLALENKNFLYLWLAELFSQLAMNMMNFILLLVAFSLTNSNTAVSGIVLSFTVPAIIFGILAGVYVDRWDKKRVLFLTNILRMALLLMLAFVHTNLIFLYSITFVIAIITQFFIPAETPLIPQLVKKDQLISANALFSMALFGSLLLAYGLSGPFLLLFGNKIAFILLAAIFFIAAIFSLLIQTPVIRQKKTKSILPTFSIRQEIQKALSVIWTNKDVYHAFLLLAFSQVLILIVSVLGPGYAKNILHININEFPLLFVTPAVIGMACGAVLMANVFHRFSRHKSANLGIFLGACAVLSMPYVPVIAAKVPFISITIIITSIAFLLGIANAFMFVPSNTLIQENTSDELRGKIYGTLNTAASLLSLLPVIVVGSLADIFGVGVVLLLLGVLIGIIGVFRFAL